MLSRKCNFYPRPPRGGRLIHISIPAPFAQFLSTPSARRATYKRTELEPSMDISIHALREEGDLIGVLHAPEPQISIHALREEGDWMAVPRFAALFRFLSTPSARRATCRWSLP